MRAEFEKSYGMMCVALIVVGIGAATAGAESEDEAYSRVIAERAAKITQGMSFSEDEQRARVESLIVGQYRTLRDIHAKRDAGGEAALISARLEMFEAHHRFIAQLAADLSCDQIEQIKDGLTYGVLKHTYNAYLEKLPDLNEVQKRAVRAFLIEGRELAMDGGSADEKHEIFRKYKGKINNFLSAAGYKL